MILLTRRDVDYDYVLQFRLLPRRRHHEIKRKNYQVDSNDIFFTERHRFVEIILFLYSNYSSFQYESI